MAKLLVVVGTIDNEDEGLLVGWNVSTGIDHWLHPLPLHTQEEIRSILNGLKSMKSVPNRNADSGSVVSRFKGRILDTTLLINPTLECLYNEIVDLLCTASPDCLVVYGGFVSEGEGDWILQDGLFVFEHILQILNDSKVLSSISDQKIKLAISCRKIGLWRNTEMSCTHDNIHLEIIDSGPIGYDDVSPAKLTGKEDNMNNFKVLLEDNIINEIKIIFSTLPPPSKEGFIKTRNPCIYIFPGGYGDSAFFAIHGFNMLVNGGSTSKPCFWKVVKHMERVDSILVTHLGVDNLPGINSFLMRKLQEQEINLPIDSTSEEYKELRRCLISPNLGPMFINAPLQYLESLSGSSPRKVVEEVEDSASPNESHEDVFILKASDVIKETIVLSKALDLKMTPLHRKSASHEPIMLFSKWGCGKLDMYVLNPVEGSKELNYMNEKYGVGGHYKIPVGKSGVLDKSGQEGTSSYADLCSIAVLLVWHPSDPNEKIVRILFPGNTSQSKIFDGLDQISDLPFMKVQHATANVVRAMEEVPKVNGASSSQKPPRPASATAKSAGRPTAHKKFTPNIGKKAGGSSNSLMKDSVSGHSKILDRRAKNEKPAITKTKTAMTATGKSATSKDKPSAAKSSKGTSGQVSTRPTPVGSATKRPAAPSSKSDMKRPVSKAASTKVKPTEKTTEKSKKPTAAVQKAKADAAKSTTKKSPRQGTKKTASKPISNKGTKVTKESLQTSPSSRKTDSSVDVSQTPVKPNTTPKSGTDVCMDKPNETVLLERQSPDGGDGSSVPCTFGKVPGDSEVQTLGNEAVKSDVDCDNLQLVMCKLCISEESDMISTDGASVVSTQPTPVGDSVSTPDVAKFEEYISSDKSTPDEEQGGGDNGGKVLPDTMTSNKESSETAVEPMKQPVIQGHEVSDETANGHDLEDAVISHNVVTIDTSATATLQHDNNCPVEAVEQKEFQNNEHSGNIAVNNQLVDCGSSQLAQVTGSDIPSSSSVEGSYELCSTGKSPLLASTQETIAETISDFKLDESVAAAEEGPTSDLQLHQTEAVEEHTISTDAFDAHDDISGVLTPSGVARVDPPFSSSDASHSMKDLAPGQELAQDIAMVQEDENQYQTEMEETEKRENFTLIAQSEDHYKAQKDVLMSNLEEGCDDQMIGDGEGGIPEVVDSVPWNEPEGQHVDPVETSHATVHNGGAEVKVGKILGLSEKELLNQDEKDDVSGDESAENSDVGDAGSMSGKQFHLEGGETDNPVHGECSDIVDTVDGHEKGFPEENKKGPISVPEVFEYSGENEVMNASDKILTDTDEKESMYIPDDSECFGAVKSPSELPDQYEKESVFIPERFDYSGTCDDENAPINEYLDQVEQDHPSVQETSEYFVAGDDAEPPMESQDEKEKECGSIPETFHCSDSCDAENVPEKEFFDEVEQKFAAVPETFEYFGAQDAEEPPRVLPDQNEKESVSFPKTFHCSDSCDAENILEKEFPNQIEQESDSVPETSEYSDEENTESTQEVSVHRSEAFVPAVYDTEEKLCPRCEDGKNEEFVSIPKALLWSDSSDAKNVPEKKHPDPFEPGFDCEYSDEENTESSQESIHPSEGFVHAVYDAEKMSLRCEDGKFAQHAIEDSHRFDETNDQDGYSGHTGDTVESGESQLPTDNIVNNNELHAARAGATNVDVDKDCPDTQNGYVNEALDIPQPSSLDDANGVGQVNIDGILDFDRSSSGFSVLHGGDHDAGKTVKKDLPKDKESSQYGTEKASLDHLNQFTSSEPDSADNNCVDQQSTCPITVSTDTNVLDVNVDQEETKKFDSPLNASAVPFIPATMQTEQSKSNNEQLGEEHGVAGYTMQGVATATPPASTNPFLLDMLTDCPSTQVEPEELFLPPTRDQDPCAGQDKFGKATTKKPSQARKPASSHVYVDLAYVPNHGDKASVGLEFFKKIRAQCYVITGSQLSKDQPTADVFDHLLQGRKSWLSEPGKNAEQEDSSVMVIPTRDSPCLQKWFDRNAQELKKYNVQIVARGSHVVMQDEIIEACKLEF